VTEQAFEETLNRYGKHSGIKQRQSFSFMCNDLEGIFERTPAIRNSGK
jgi:hypothetical protein